MIGRVTHDFGRNYGFFGDGYVAGACRNHCNNSFAILFFVSLEHDGSRQVAIFRSADLLLHGGELFFIGVGRQYVAAMLSEAGKDLRHMRRRFLLAENYFWHSASKDAMMIDLGKTQVFERQVTQALDRVVRREFASADRVEEFADGICVHGGRYRRVFDAAHAAPVSLASEAKR